MIRIWPIRPLLLQHLVGTVEDSGTILVGVIERSSDFVSRISRFDHFLEVRENGLNRNVPIRNVTRILVVQYTLKIICKVEVLDVTRVCTLGIGNLDELS